MADSSTQRTASRGGRFSGREAGDDLLATRAEAAVFGDLNARRSAIQGTENRAGSNVIRVEVPLAQMFGYATDLRSRTQGRATFTMHFSHYAETPPNISEEVIKRVKGTK